ncbi:MAG: hypothetical protein ACREI9_06075 [Nitrospiraceae bacterium]
MLGNLDAAVLSDSQNAVVIQQGFRAGLFLRFDDIFEQHPVLELDRNGFLNAGVSDIDFSFNRRKNPDVYLIFGSGRVVRPGHGSREQQRSQSCRHLAVFSYHGSLPLFLLTIACCTLVTHSHISSYKH